MLLAASRNRVVGAKLAITPDSSVAVYRVAALNPRDGDYTNMWIASCLPTITKPNLLNECNPDLSPTDRRGFVLATFDAPTSASSKRSL